MLSAQLGNSQEKLKRPELITKSQNKRKEAQIVK